MPTHIRFLILPLFIISVALCSPQLTHATAPSVSIVGVSPLGAISASSTVTFSAAATGFVDPTYTLSDSYSGAGSTLGTIDNIGSFTWTPTIYDGGKHTIMVTVTDSMNDIATTTVNITVAANTVLLSTPSPGPIITPGRAVSFSAYAPGFVNPTYSVYDSAYSPTIFSTSINSSGAFSWTPSLADVGVHTLTVHESDAYGHSGQASTQITVVNPSVTIQSLSPGSSGKVGSPITFIAGASSLATTTYSVADTFSGTSTITSSNIASNGLFSWLPTASDLGNHVLTITASDVYGNTASTSLPLYVGQGTATVVPLTTPAVAAPATTTTPVVTAPPTVVTAPSSTPKYTFTTYLGIGSRGTAVTALQNKLIALGYLKANATGYFGVLTAAAVKVFQAAHKIATVGYVGPSTRAALNSL